MQPLVERAAAVMNRMGRSAVPLAELVERLRDNGFSVSEAVLTRSLSAEPERFRLIEPWRALRAAGQVGSNPWGGERVWVVAPGANASDAAASPRPALARLRGTMAALSWELDVSSSTDVARWFGMMIEVERLREALPTQRVGVSAPPVSASAPSAPTAASATPRPRPPAPPAARARPPRPRGFPPRAPARR